MLSCMRRVDESQQLRTDGPELKPPNGRSAMLNGASLGMAA